MHSSFGPPESHLLKAFEAKKGGTCNVAALATRSAGMMGMPVAMGGAKARNGIAPAISMLLGTCTSHALKMKRSHRRKSADYASLTLKDF